jgi:putative hemolysin
LNASLPNVGDIIQLDDYELEIIDKDGQRIDKILVKAKTQDL